MVLNCIHRNFIILSQSVFHVQNQEYVGELFLFIPIYSILFQGVFGKSQGVLGHEIQSGF